jgi:HAE1 family hydrophobic/amphiphilic exporter-1
MIRIELPSGTSTEHTARVAQQAERILKRQVPEALLTYIQAGESEQSLGSSGSNVARIGCLVPRLAERDRTVFEIARVLRPHIAEIPGLVSYDVGQGSAMGGTPGFGGGALVVEIFTDDPNRAREAAIGIREIVSGTSGTSDVSTDLITRTPELRVRVDRERASRLGVPMAKVASAVRVGVHGHAVTRFRGGDQDVELILRLREEDRSSVEAVRRLTVPSFSGAQIRLDNVAEVTEDESPVEIRRLDGARTLRVMSGIEDRSLSEVAADIEKGIAQARRRGEIDPEVETRLAGEVEEQRSMGADLGVALALAILLVYLVMAAQFESLLDPLVIMFSVPFGITGVFLALLVTGTTLQITSFMGVIIIVGIVVNNAIVLIDYVNEMRRQGMEMHEAVARGGERRLRPVMMTTLTTIAGMLPLAMAKGEGSEIWQPMGIAVIGGLSLSMLVTLVLVPAVYVATERFRKVRGLRTGT